MQTPKVTWRRCGSYPYLRASSVQPMLTMSTNDGNSSEDCHWVISSFRLLPYNMRILWQLPERVNTPDTEVTVSTLTSCYITITANCDEVVSFSSVSPCHS